MYRSHPITILAGGVLAAALAGCGGGGGTASPFQVTPSTNTQTSLTSAQQSDLVYSTTHEFGDSIETGLGGSASSIDRSAQALNPCITPSPNPPVIDPNGIPKNETYTYSNCQNLGWASGETINGQLNITDTSPAGGSTTSYTQTNTNLSVSGSDNGNAYTEVENGTRFPAISNNILSVTRSMQVARTTGNGTVNISQNWSWSLTPAVGQTIQLLHAWPAGQFTSASGTITYANATMNVTLTFANTSPLTYDPTCTTAPRITAGAVSFTVTGGAKSGSFTATWNGCGPPTIANSGS